MTDVERHLEALCQAINKANSILIPMRALRRVRPGQLVDVAGWLERAQADLAALRRATRP